MSGWQSLGRGVARQNPVFVLLLGLCPALAITTRLANALGMGAAVLLVLTATNLLASLLGSRVPERLRLPALLLLTALLVGGVDLAMQARAPGLRRELGIFVPLIAVNCLILGRGEASASWTRPSEAGAGPGRVGRAVLDGVGMGLGFTLGLALIAAVREALGSGTLTLFPWRGFSGVVRLPWLAENPARVLVLAPGALLSAGLLKGLFNWLALRREERKVRAA